MANQNSQDDSIIIEDIRDSLQLLAESIIQLAAYKNDIEHFKIVSILRFDNHSSLNYFEIMVQFDTNTLKE